MPNQPVIKVLQAGDTNKSDPYTIAIINNPSYELDEDFYRDPINDAAHHFEESVNYIYDCLFGKLPRQAEKFLTDPSIFSKIRVLSVWTSGLPVEEANALILVSGIFRARQHVFKNFFERFDLKPDVVFAVTHFSPRKKASGFRTIDDVSSGGIDFEYDGSAYRHLYRPRQPGAIAIHTADRSMTALHEFSHAASSFPNGYIADLYNNDRDEETLIANKKFGRRIPRVFCTYNGTTYLSNPKRHDDAKKTFHSELIDKNFPALMDDYRITPNGYPEQCQHDKLTRQFLLDRIQAKTDR